MSLDIRTLAVGVGTLREDDPALLAAVRLAAQTGATLHAVHAFDLPDPLLEAYARHGHLDAGVVSRYGDQLRTCLEELLAPLAPRQSVVCHVRNDSAARVLAEVTAEIGADLLLVGAGAHSRVLHFFLGSTADAVVRVASVPVMVVREGAGWSLGRVLLTTDLSPFSAVVHDRGLELVTALQGGP